MRVLLPDVDLLDPALHASGRAHAAFAALREHEPISWRGQYWAITRHADVRTVGEDWERFSSAHGTGLSRVEGPLRSIHISDPPLHTEMRALFEAGYGHGWLRRLAAPLRDRARELVASWSGEVDAVATLADPLAFGVLEELLGERLPALLPTIHRYARYDDARYRRPGESPAECFRDAERTVWSMLEAIVADRRARPQDDMPSRLRLSGDDLLYALRFVVQTTYQTTALAIAACVATLARHRPTDPVRAADEILRVHSPVIRFAREVTRDTTLGDTRLRAGERVVMFYGSANRDERVFARPELTDLERAPNPHVAFGAGPHACLGAGLARVQLGAVIEALRDRPYELVEEPRWFHSSVNAGYDRVLVRV